jgi:hypothetical protein
MQLASKKYPLLGLKHINNPIAWINNSILDRNPHHAIEDQVNLGIKYEKVGDNLSTKLVLHVNYISIKLELLALKINNQHTILSLREGDLVCFGKKINLKLNPALKHIFRYCQSQAIISRQKGLLPLYHCLLM